jgi:predicted AlkP superfamily pyrophosphatase or phosphodiesterase
MPHKLIVLMIDGVSADYFATERGRLPHLSALAERGMVVENLHSEVLGTSLPGRTSMLTGAKADVSGVYGNMILDGERFRYPSPYDVRLPTIATRAKDAGRDVAVMGFGMIRPEDTHSFMPPWWLGSFIQRARDPQPVPVDEGWLRVFEHQNADERFIQACADARFPNTWPAMEAKTSSERLMWGIVCDQHALNWVGILAACDNPPDLIMAEFLTTDTVQHYTGYKSEMSHWSVALADMLVGNVMQFLRSARIEDQWNIAVMSDHGHSPIETALHPAVIIPGVTFQSEGSILLVAPKDADELERVTGALAEYDCEPYPVNFVPLDHRERLAAFVAPDGVSFEYDPNLEVTEPTGKPTAISSHGLRPGRPGDDRFAVFAGPDVASGIVQAADAVQVSPTFASLLGLAVEDYDAEPIFVTQRA